MNNLTGIRDVDRKILMELSDKDILTICSVNREYSENICNETFFRNVIQKKYPYLIELKDALEKYKNLSWKDFFLRMVYYISYLEENADVPYIVYSSEDPQFIYNRFRKLPTKRFYNFMFKSSLRTENKEIIEKMYNKLIIDKLEDITFPLYLIAIYELFDIFKDLYLKQRNNISLSLERRNEIKYDLITRIENSQESEDNKKILYEILEWKY